MKLSSTRLGEIDVDPSTFIEMQGGLLGFPDAVEFVLVPADDVGAYVWMQDTHNEHLAFLALAPNLFFAEYEPEIEQSDAEELGITDSTQTQLLCLVSIAQDSITANLLGPIVLNVENRVARQVVLNDQDYGAKVALGGS